MQLWHRAIGVYHNLKLNKMTHRSETHNHCLRCNNEKYETKTFIELKQVCFISKLKLESPVVLKLSTLTAS